MTRRLLIVLMVLGLAAAAVVLVARARLESRYRAVEIVLDGDDWMTLARREGAPLDQVLRQLHERGATSVALAEPTLKRMADDGLIAYASGGGLTSAARLSPLAPPLSRLHVSGVVRPDAVYVAGASEHLDFVAARLHALLGARRVRRLQGAVEVLGTVQDLEEIGLGYRPSDAVAVRAAGLDVVLRPRNYRGLSPESLRVLVESYAQVAPEPTVIFALTEVQGYEGLIRDAAAAYQRAGARFGRIEVFTARRKQRGEDQFTALMRPAVIRVFSITPEELQTLRVPDAADRFVRAAQERNIRLLYVRPLLATPAGEPALAANLNLVETVSRNLRSFGFSPARSRPLPPLETPRPLLWAVAAGAIAMVLLVAGDMAAALGVPIAPRLVWGLLLLGVAGSAALSVTPFELLWRQVMALGAAVAGAAGAVVWALPRPGARRRPGGSGLVRAGWLTLARALALAVAAGLFVAGLLSQWPFMLAFSTFLGVKAAHVLPVVLVGLWLAFDSRDRGGWQATVRDLTHWINQPLRLGAMLVILVVGLAGVVLLARTGNVGLPLTGIEQQARATLEDLLIARPRTKEFLLGYPALVLAGLSAVHGWRRATIPLAMAGAIGTAGAINSFSHLHTPLLYTFWRTGNALLLGAVLAIPPAVVLLWIGRRIARS
ncbi:MAG: DUF5693 family protein [Armatimonadota bacterium]|nr:DUF5693 family protein [Armatimonadota bacterium]